MADEQNPNQPPPPMTSGEPDTRDLGFGSVISQEQHTRLLNRDGSFNVHRRGLSFWTQLNAYHALLTMRWWKFNLLLVLFYVFVNLFFAMAYLLCGTGALHGDSSNSPFLQALYFSVETYSTIGYGNIAPTTRAANFVVATEAFTGLVSVAMATGLLFARFSRPTADIIYSRNAIIAPYLNKTAFMFRITNARNNQIIDLAASVVLSRFEQVDGRAQRKYHTLSLERDTVAFFPLAWTVVHPIDRNSPLYGWDAEMLQNSAAEFLILLKGYDETFAEQVHSRTSYTSDEVLWNVRFVTLYEKSPDGVTIDVERLHQVEPVRPAVERTAIQ
jgi:inward rectifier potassium channel